VDEFTILDESLGLSGFVGGNAPVQGEGRVFGYPFYFRARGVGWTCAIYLNREYPWASDNYAGVEPDDAHDVFFVESGVAGFVHSGDDDNASYMPVEKAKQLIRACAASFIQKMAPSSLLPLKPRSGAASGG
jgi:hypothetical protein